MSSPEHSIKRQARRSLFNNPWTSLPLSLVTGYISAVLVLKILMTLAILNLLFMNIFGFSILFGVVLFWQAKLFPSVFRSIGRRLTRFSMRTLLLFISVVAMLAATVGNYYVRLYRERAVVAKLDA